MHRQALLAGLAAVTLTLPCVAACGRPSSGYERYVPTAAAARQALEQALTAWKDGQRPGPLKSNTSPITIQVSDARRRAGRKLIDYQLLGEISGEGPRTFIVRLKFEKPSVDEEVRYYLVGIDPLWIFRQEDYDAVAHWDVCREDDES